MSVYAIVDGLDVKIGVSVDVKRRMRDLQTGNPRPLKCLYVFTTKQAHEYESVIHDFLEPYDARNHYGWSSAREWFHVGDVKTITERMFQLINYGLEQGYPVRAIGVLMCRHRDWVMTPSRTERLEEIIAVSRSKKTSAVTDDAVKKSSPVVTADDKKTPEVTAVVKKEPAATNGVKKPPFVTIAVAMVKKL